MAIRISKNVKIILFVVLGILVLGGGGYLLWRVNQPDTVAPTDSDAACPSGCGYYDRSIPVCNGTAPNYTRGTYTAVTGCYKSVDCANDGSPCRCYIFCSGGTSDPSTPGQPTFPDGCRSLSTVYSVAEESKCNSDHKACNEDEQGRCYYSSITNKIYGLCCPVDQAPQTINYTLKYSSDSNGTLTGSTTQTVEKGQSGSAVTAVANSGYEFLKWSDGSTSNPRTDSNVQGNITVTATYVVEATVGVCENDIWITKPVSEYEYCDVISAVVENGDTDGIDLESIVVKLDGSTKLLCSSNPGQTCYTTSVVESKTRISMTLNENYCQSSGEHTISFTWNDGEGNTGCNLSTTFTIAEEGEEVAQAPTVPQTGIFDTVLGRISFGFGFIALGGMVSQYSKLNIFYDGLVQRSQFKKDIRKERRRSRRRGKLEERFK